jgi:probable FeS assembly SUF system protein SufT
MNGTILTIQRNCDALLIPNGIPVTLREGEQVMITQAVGGNFTLQVHGNLVRLGPEDADALGIDPELLQKNSFAIPDTLDDDAVWETLATVFDPEIPVNIVELGLIYNMQLKEISEGYAIDVEMTLTAPGCGMGPVLVEDVKDRLGQLPGVAGVNVELTFEPPWNQALMSEAAKLQLGML